jgi:hypothetical protein
MLLQHEEEQSLCMVCFESWCFPNAWQQPLEDEFEQNKQLTLNCAQLPHDLLLMEAEAYPQLIG